MTAYYLLWQLADSGFPAGSFAHSGGLEAALQHGYVKDAADVESLARHVLTSTGRGSLPIVRVAHADEMALVELDRFSDAFLTNPVAHRASCSLGRAFLTSTNRAFPDAGIQRVTDRISAESLTGHYAPVFGVVTRRLGVELRDAERLFLYLSIRGTASSAVRLGAIGAYDAQRLISRLASQIEEVADRCAGLSVLEVAQTSPLLDLFQARHDRLYSRLFQS
jgi:urease accessory protein